MSYITAKAKTPSLSTPLFNHTDTTAYCPKSKDDNVVKGSAKILYERKSCLLPSGRHQTVDQLQNAVERQDRISRKPSINNPLNDLSSDSCISDIDSECEAENADLYENELSNNIPEEFEEEKELSFYTQSCRFHAQQQLPEETEVSRKAEGLLKYGIDLNSTYLKKFETKRKQGFDDNNFYEGMLDEKSLETRRLQNPKKYIRCVIQIEGSHEANCTPIESSLGISVVEISGRSKIGQVFNEDEVLVELLDDKLSYNKRHGKVLGVINRKRHKNIKHPVFLCTLDEFESHLMKPICKTIPKIHIINDEIKENAISKMKRFKVVIYDYDEKARILYKPRIIDVNPSDLKSYVFLVAYITWSRKRIYPLGAVLNLLPWKSNIQRGLMILNLQHHVPCLYRKETVEMVETMTQTQEFDAIDPTALEGRLDLTNMTCFTIDPPDSKELDDALSIETYNDGYRVGVHISDVSCFVKKNDALDKEAMERATSFYSIIKKPRHMIPEPLSQNLCSLLPGKKRLTVSMFFHLAQDGRPVQKEGQNFEIKESFIRSSKKLTYGEAQCIINSESCEDKLSEDVLHLYKLAKQIRERRLGKAMFALAIDCEEHLEGESLESTAQAQFLVEEFMIMANSKVAEILVRHYKNCVPIRTQPPPGNDSLQDFVKTNGNFIDVVVQLQDRSIAGQRREVGQVLSQSSAKHENVLVERKLWDRMEQSPESAIKCLQQDNLFPLQHVVYQNWISIQESAEYRCYNVNLEKSQKHFSLKVNKYTHFTSPIRRYNDLIVHRLLRALLRKKQSPYSENEIIHICTLINSATKRSKGYRNGCKALQQAVQLYEKPQMVSCFVENVSDQKLTFCSPQLKYAKKINCELNFNLLHMRFKPEDNSTHRGVKAIWRKRVYDHKGIPLSYRPDSGKELELNPHKDMLYVALPEWGRLLLAAIDRRKKDVKSIITHCSPKPHNTGLDDINTECNQPGLLQPQTEFTMAYSRGQTLSVQMYAAPCMGMLVATPMSYKMTDNIHFCLLHTSDPVAFLYHYSTKPTSDQYLNIQDYLECWLPLVRMEAAMSAVRNEESCYINNVPIKFKYGAKTGKFSLSQTYCEFRNIVLAGTRSGDESDDEEDDGNVFDWLCIKAPIPEFSSLEREKQCALQNYWIGHAQVRSVVKKNSKNVKKISVTFKLHEKSLPIPFNVLQSKVKSKYSIEILKKTEDDRYMLRFFFVYFRSDLFTC